MYSRSEWQRFRCLLLQDGELPLLHGQHLEGVDVEAVVVRRGEVEDAARPDEALEVLDGGPDRLLVGRLRILDRLDQDGVGVVGVTAEGAALLPHAEVL